MSVEVGSLAGDVYRVTRAGLMCRIVMRPRVKGEKAGLQMPLLVKPLAAQ